MCPVYIIFGTGNEEDRFCYNSEDKRTKKGPWDSAGERKMVECFGSERGERGREVMDEIMGCLEREGFFDFGIRGDEEVEEDQGWEEGVKEDI